MLSIAADGTRLISYIILRKLKNPPAVKTSSNIALTTSDSGFMDQNLMLDYVDRVILPQTKFINSDGSIGYHPCLLILDDFSAHKVQRVFEYMRKFNILPYFIPGGYTYCGQPLDVVLNRPFKCRLRVLYEDHQYLVKTTMPLDRHGKKQSTWLIRRRNNTRFNKKIFCMLWS